MTYVLNHVKHICPNRILSDVNGTDIVTIDGKMFLMNTIIKEKFLHSQKLGATTASSNVFNFNSR